MSNEKMPFYSTSATLISTLGSEPQVVTSTIHLLLARGVPLRRVFVLHTCPSQGPIYEAVETLRLDAAHFMYPQPIEFHFAPVMRQSQPVVDLDTPSGVDAAFRTLYGLVRASKLEGEQVHLSIAGGRKNLTAYAVVAAQLLFDDADCLWHLYSSGEFLASKRLHPQMGDDVRLMSIPVLLRDYISPALTLLRHIEDPYEALEQIRRLNSERRMQRVASFVKNNLTPAEQRVVALLVRLGLADLEMAERLALSPRTIEQHLRSAYAKAAEEWELESVTRVQLISLLYPYFSLPGSQKNTGNPA